MWCQGCSYHSPARNALSSVLIPGIISVLPDSQRQKPQGLLENSLWSVHLSARHSRQCCLRCLFAWSRCSLSWSRSKKMFLPQPLCASDKMLGRVIDSEITKCFFLQRGMEKVPVTAKTLLNTDVVFQVQVYCYIPSPPIKCRCVSRYESWGPRNHHLETWLVNLWSPSPHDFINLFSWWTPPNLSFLF